MSMIIQEGAVWQVLGGKDLCVYQMEKYEKIAGSSRIRR
jgi:hypothetical protein